MTYSIPIPSSTDRDEVTRVIQRVLEEMNQGSISGGKQPTSAGLSPNNIGGGAYPASPTPSSISAVYTYHCEVSEDGNGVVVDSDGNCVLTLVAIKEIVL